MDSPQKMIVVIADGVPLQSLKVDHSITLPNLRNKVNTNKYIKSKLTHSLLYVHNGKLIDSGNESTTKLADILAPDQFEVHLNSKLNSINIIVNEKQKHTKQVPLAFSLSSLRNLDPKLFPLHLNFFKNDKIIRLADEARIKISDILVNNTVHIQSAEVSKHVAFEAQAEEQVEVEQPRKTSAKGRGRGKKEIKQKVEMMKFNILIDRQKSINSEFDISQPLRSLREATKEIAGSMDFCWKNGPINEEDELDIRISDILDEPIQSAHTIINKQKKSQNNLKDTINVIWVAEKYENLKNDPGFNKDQTECSLKGNISKYLNLNSIDINVLPKGCILDPDGNPADSKYDLGIDGMFSNFKILIGAFYNPIDVDIHKTAFLALEGKGFKVESVLTELEFAQKLPDFDQGWVISNNLINNSSQLVDAVKKHLAQKKGLLIWADNQPYFKQANVILDALNLEVPIQLNGNDDGTKMLSRIDAQQAVKSTFIQHQITTGIFRMNEGITICYPESQKVNGDQYGQLQIIGVGSAGRPSYMSLEGTESRGRIIIDCGFTKLMSNWWNGNWRYVRNCAVWLLWLESKLND